jgi:hypothetical protein
MFVEMLVSMFSLAVQKACEFLVSKQRDDGGWGESHTVRFMSAIFPGYYIV